MHKIYTKQGDQGETDTFSGQRVSKASAFIEIYGHIDELNTFLGFAAEGLRKQKDFAVLYARLRIVQRELFFLATQFNAKGAKAVDFDANIRRLEEEIDDMSRVLPPLKKFILPAGGEVAARLHLARVVARRLERVVIRFRAEVNLNPKILAYLNRLSDWLFTVARFVALQMGIEEEEFQH